jgi:FkbM family methyltransferase
MFQSINKLKTNGYEPATILDIGAYCGNWTTECLKIFPSAQYHLFEAIEYDELTRFANMPNVNVLSGVILDAEEREMKWYQMKNTGDSMFKEKTTYFDKCQVILRRTSVLDNMIDASELENVLMKIDCQGAEIPILQGASQVLKKTDFIILEVPYFGQYNEGVPNFLEHIKFMDSIGFIPYDISDIHRRYNFTIQVDIMFINRNHPFNDIVQQRFSGPTLG